MKPIAAPPRPARGSVVLAQLGASKGWSVPVFDDVACLRPLRWRAMGASQGGDGGQGKDLFEKYGLPVAFGIAAVVSFLFKQAGGGDIFVLLGVICAVTAVVIVLRMRSGVQQQEAIARRSTVPVSDDTRRQMLQEYLSEELYSGRGRVESATAYTAVVVEGKPVNHVLHLLVTVLLCGLWLPIWIIAALNGGERRRVLSVDRCGNVISR
jgi:hypothetical protein